MPARVRVHSSDWRNTALCGCSDAGFSEVCVPEVGPYEYCAVNTVLSGLHAVPGWIGMCAADTVCAPALGVNSAGNPITAEGEGIPDSLFPVQTGGRDWRACRQTSTCETGLMRLWCEYGVYNLRIDARRSICQPAPSP